MYYCNQDHDDSQYEVDDEEIETTFGSDTEAEFEESEAEQEEDD